MTPLALGESEDVYYYEALAVLGIDEQTSRDSARRAYLRLLKRHKPEQDPEGFKRLREAYDLVREVLPEVELAREQPEPEPSEASAHRGPPPSSAPSRREVDELVEREPEASARAGLTPDLAPPPSEPPPPLSGEHVPDEEPPPPDSIPDWFTLYRRAEEAESSSDWPLVYAALELAARHVDAPEPPITATLRMLLRCVRDNEQDGYRTLLSALTHWTTATGMEARAFRGERVVLWTVIRELGDVGRRLPRLVTRAIATAMLDGSLENARSELETYARAFPEEAITAATVLFEHAQYLHRTVGPMLHTTKRVYASQYVPDPTPSASDAGGWRVVFPILAVALFAMRFCLKSDPSPSTRFDPATFHFTVPPPMPSLIFPELDPPALTWARMLRDDPFNVAEPALRWATLDLVVKIQGGDCARSREAFTKYVQLLNGSGATPQDHRRSYIEELDKSLEEWCARTNDAGADATVTDAKIDARGADR